MAPGEYEFGTSTVEDHDRRQRRPHGQAAGKRRWKDYKAAQSFTVGAGKKFQLKVAADAAYLCLYR